MQGLEARLAYRHAERHGVDWWIHRVAISEQYRCPPHAVRAWPFSDLLDAHVVLDTVDRLREIQHAEAEREAAKRAAAARRGG